jgi:hypothetical protein
MRRYSTLLPHAGHFGIRDTASGFKARNLGLEWNGITHCLMLDGNRAGLAGVYAQLRDRETAAASLTSLGEEGAHGIA